ncbi:unnamed protein product [Acanthoscelides obtectus]|uniref:Uncharacterized protein n=2 Tax=Acanthoscelides obtectus TaxID=200917 RepID=A0A9P0Q5P6_ACAOB|nr:unnamed protein product [Acanthoscelides obtectus]CAK1652160.1 Ras-specific guanine nucleotide-releasing factor 1 [Acanthoscelides obtectus]
MLSLNMQRQIRVNENQLIVLSERARFDHSQAGYLHKRSADNSKWRLKWFVLYQNLLFYYDSKNSLRPAGLLLLEGCYCERLITTVVASKSMKVRQRQQFRFEITYRRENVRQYEFRALNEMNCNNWIEAIRYASFSRLLLQKEELEQKHLHLLQVVESEKTAKWQYAQQCEELSMDIEKMRAELLSLIKERKPLAKHQSNGILSSVQGTSSGSMPSQFANLAQDSIELRKIKKVQRFWRSWLCRRRWRQIVEQYTKSRHAESMRKRYSLVVRLVEAEEEYVKQLEVLVTCFLRPFKMAASSKMPPCSHEDVNSIFLNSENVMFLHQIFLRGLTSRLESWPTLVLGDLFSMLLPMLSIYHEYVRNHHYSLQILTECKQSPAFSALLKRLEFKPLCRGRSLEMFLTYPMHQVPRYIIALHELLAHTPHNHVERKSLQNARQQLEDLSRMMHDEVSEMENLRQNLAVENMIVEDCDILLDVNQVLVRKGCLIQLSTDKHKASRRKIFSLKSKEQAVRQCYLFSNHLILATRTSTGKLHLVPEVGKISLADVLLIEDPTDTTENDGASSQSSQSAAASSKPTTPINYQNRDFKIIVETKRMTSHQLSVHLLAATAQEKAAWVSDIIQCLDNMQFNKMAIPHLASSSSIGMPQSLKNDPNLFKDEADMKFSRTLNSCTVPQIRYATPERLLQGLTDLRFLSGDFLDTFLLTYRVFTEGVTVLDALKKVFYSVSHEPGESTATEEEDVLIQPQDDNRRTSTTPRRTSAVSSVSGYGSETGRDRSHSYASQVHRQWTSTLQKYEEEVQETQTTVGYSTSKAKMGDSLAPPGPTKSVSIRVDTPSDETSLTIPKVTQSSTSETLTGTEVTILSAPCSPKDLSFETLVGSAGSDANEQGTSSSKQSTKTPTDDGKYKEKKDKDKKEKTASKDKSLSPTKGPVKNLKKGLSTKSEDLGEEQPPSVASHRASCSSSRSTSISTTTGVLQSYYSTNRSMQDGESSIARSSFQHGSPQRPSKAGVVITSFRLPKRRSSNSAVAAFAIATSACSNPRDVVPAQEQEDAERARHKERVMSSACIRVVNVLQHWISEHPQDFKNDPKLKNMTIEFLDDIIYSPNLLPAEHTAAAQLLKMLTREDAEGSKISVFKLVALSRVSSKESIETLSALEIAEQMTYLDHHVFVAISADEFLGQAWIKADNDKRAPHVVLMTKRFNEVSTLVVLEILKCKNLKARVAAIEKWAAVCDICRYLQNFNGVLQICSAFTNTFVCRLTNTWEKVSKTTKNTIEKLQSIVAPDGHYRALRDTLHRCDPPCIPYLGLYLSYLAFIEEDTSTFTTEGLLNFAKMRTIARVIREIRHFQQTPYKIDLIPKVANYLLASPLLRQEEALYAGSLELEPRTSGLVFQSSTTTPK